jgi:hypothetical protein
MSDRRHDAEGEGNRDKLSAGESESVVNHADNVLQ